MGLTKLLADQETYVLHYLQKEMNRFRSWRRDGPSIKNRIEV